MREHAHARPLPRLRQRTELPFSSSRAPWLQAICATERLCASNCRR